MNDKSFDSSKNYVQGDNLILKCPVSGFPYPRVSWFHDGVMLTAGDRIVISNEGNIVNGKLTIYSLEFEDKGTYMCMANSTYAMFQPVQATINVRVKGKLCIPHPGLEQSTGPRPVQHSDIITSNHIFVRITLTCTVDMFHVNC